MPPLAEAGAAAFGTLWARLRLEQKIAVIAIPAVILVGGVAMAGGGDGGGGSDGAPVASLEKGEVIDPLMGQVEVFWETDRPASCEVKLFSGSKFWTHEVTVDESETGLTSSMFQIGSAANTGDYRGYEVSCHE